MERSYIEQRVLDAIVPALLVFLMDNIKRENKRLFDDGETLEIYNQMNDAVTRSLRAESEKLAKTLVLKHNIAMRHIVSYIVDELVDSRKGILTVMEWGYALHDAGAIDIGSLGFGDALNKIDDIFHERSDERLVKSADKQVPKLHKHASKVLII